MTTHKFRPLSHSLQSRLSRCLVLLSALGCASALPACGAQSSDSVDSTDTGNPPAIDQTALSVVAGEEGTVVVSAESGGVSPGGIEVTVTNTTADESASTTAAEDGSFEVTVPGTVEDEYEVTVGSGDDTDTVVLEGDDPGPSDDPNALSGLVGNDYLLESSEGFTPVEGTNVRITFDETEFGFSAGCNGHGGEFTFCDGRLCIGDMSSTLIGCDAPLAMQDDWLADFFTSTPTVVRMGERVTFEAEGATLVFLDTESANPDRSLTGRTWTIDTLIDGGAASSVPSEAPPMLEFSDDGSLSLNTSCAGGEGTFEVNGDTIDLSEVSVAEEPCGETGSQFAHDHILSVMTQGEVTFTIDEARLTIMRGDIGLGATTE
jgi:heat shock protein HslJ